MNCPCGARAVSFGPFGNACAVHVPTPLPGKVRLPDVEEAWAAIRRRQALDRKEDAVKVTDTDTSRCACGLRATRWYEGGQSCWFCVPRRTTQDEARSAAMTLAWAQNMDRVEAVARRQHRRWAVLNIARQTKDQYPVALRDWELWQVAKVQEDGRLKDVLAKSRPPALSRRQLETLQQAQTAVLARRGVAIRESRARIVAEGIVNGSDRPDLEVVLEGIKLLEGAQDAQRSATPLSIDPAPYFAGPKEWEAAFYKALQSVHEDTRCDMDTEYRQGNSVLIRQFWYRQGRAPTFDSFAPPDLVRSMLLP